MARKMTKKNNITIEEISKENPFKVPDHYFENFSVRMSDKISQAEAAKAPVMVNTWAKPRMAAIFTFAGIAIILLVGIIFINLRNKPLSSHEMVEAYKYSAIQDLNDEQLAEMIAAKQEEQQIKADTAQQAVEKDEIIEYLSKDNIDINTIIDAQ